jgi:succinate-semialdehyde dehydrogenase/glutarate-semialdehyde dehydrogenase
MSRLAAPSQHAAFIDGAWVQSDSGARIEVMDPANIGCPEGPTARIGYVPDCGRAETERAIAAAARTQPLWASWSARKRAKILLRMVELMGEHEEHLAHICTYENGKPLAESIGEIRYGASFIQWFAEEGQRVYGESIPASSAQQRILVSKEPVGVCAAITPWNFPSAMLARKLGAALAAGCALVAKPSEETPVSALALAELAQKAGLPDGLFSVVTGQPDPIGRALCASEIVRKLSFTGSTAVGRLLMERCAPTVKRLSLELGGNAPFIVFDDADMEKVIDGAMASKFRNCGQTCIASNRFLVHASRVDEFAQTITEQVSKLRVGHGLEKGVQIGPLINAAGLAKVQRILSDALDKGAHLHTGGSLCSEFLEPAAEYGRLFLEPTVLSGITAEMAASHEEIFGPVVAIRSFETDEEVIEMANDTPWGLAAYVFTQDMERSWRIPEALEFGMIGLNTGQISTPQAPFGGIKQSGMGREGSHFGIDEYLSLKYTCIDLG